MDEIPSAEQEPSPEAFIPTFNVDVATVSIVDGMWQDQPDNVAAFVETRLGELARGRGNLYIALDVSGDVEGRSEVERGLIEVIRDTFASSRGSISFALSEALRAANVHLFESNRQVGRDARRMAGVSAVVLRGNDLYVAQAGPTVVYVEANEKLARYPAESDWFVEDAPLIAPQGTASAPLGIRREFASDLAHTSIGIGDVFVLATRALTQLASTEELAIAFTERTADDIARHLEELGEDADVTALVAELMDPNAVIAEEATENKDAEGEPADHIESLPVPLNSLVPPDENEPPLEEEEEESALDWEDTPASPLPVAEQELNWDDDGAEVDPEGDAPGLVDEPTIDSEPQPIYAAAAALPLTPPPPAFVPPPPPPPYPTDRDARYTMRQEPLRPQPYPQPHPQQVMDAELEQRRAERAARRAAQKENVSRAVGGAAGGLAAIFGAFGAGINNTFGTIDWDGIGKQINRFLNIGVGALLTFFLLLVRLVLPGATPRATTLIPRRATSEPVWLKALALVLPVLFIGLAGGAYMNRQSAVSAQYDALIAQADTMVKQAEVNPDKVQAREQLNDALRIVRESQEIKDTTKARGVLYRIQDQLNEIDGVAVLYFLPTLAELDGADVRQVAASDQDVFLLDGRGTIYKYIVNDGSGTTEPSPNEGVLLKVGDSVGDETIEALRLLTTAAPTEDKETIIAITEDSILTYDTAGDQWTASKADDANEWTDLRAIDSFGGNIYLLDAKKAQILRYTPTATGYTAEGAPYFPANAQPVLSKAVDMAIDGDIWVLNDNGTVMRFRAGVPVPFELAPLPTPLKNPVAIYTRTGVDSLYVADAGNQRIIEYDKTGKYVRQFKPYAEKGDVFQNLKDFTVNETKGKLYFVNADAAYMANVQK
jgi:hypothetical protein